MTRDEATQVLHDGLAAEFERRGCWPLSEATAAQMRIALDALLADLAAGTCDPRLDGAGLLTVDLEPACDEP